MVKIATLYTRLTPLFGVIVIVLIIYFITTYYNNINCQVEGMEADEEPPTTEQAYLVNNILAKIAVDDPELSNLFSISIIRGLGITSSSFAVILDKDVPVKQKLRELAGRCKSTRPDLPTGFEYATLPDNLFGKLKFNNTNKK